MKTVSRITLPARDRLMEAVHACLAADAVALLAQWRRDFRTVAHPSARALIALEQLLVPRPFSAGGHAPRAAVSEQIHYTAQRLAKLGMPLQAVNQAFEQFRPLAAARLRACMGARAAAATTALGQFEQQTALVVAQAYVEVQSGAVEALLAVLDAELNSPDLDELLRGLLYQAAQVFPIRWGEILLLDATAGGAAPVLRHQALYGFKREMVVEAAGIGPFFQRVMREGTPGFLLDAERDSRIAQPYYRALRVKSVWAVPLSRQSGKGTRRGTPHGGEVLGVLAVSFDKVYECLPQERELLRALAERSTLAIERTRMAESLHREQKRTLELSRRVLDAQDEERRRISRDLHDETGQALLALRLYLEMGLRERPAAPVRLWIERGVALVDSSVAELRRLLVQLSPLVLDELGLEAALRLELRRRRGVHRWHTRFAFSSELGRLARPLETLIYRVVVEGLHNIARHARAENVRLNVQVRPRRVLIRLSDDGVGMAASPEGGTKTRFGLAGMRERLSLVSGRLEIVSAPGAGVALCIEIPLPQALPGPTLALPAALAPAS